MPRCQPTLLAAALWAAFPAAQAADATLAEVRVQSDKDDFEARQAATSTKLVYGREELDRMNELTLGDYLRRLPSVTFTGPPGNPADVRLRGMDKGYTQILIDGEPVATGTKERQLQVDRLSLDMVERIEIIRAPTADLPNEGLMGTINIVLRDIPGKQVRNARLVAGRVFGEKTDLDTWNLSGQYGDGTGDVRWLMNASVGSRGNPKSKTKNEAGFNTSGVTLGLAKDAKTEFEDERTRSDTLDFSPRLNLRLGGGDELVFTPWLSRTEDDKRKRVDTSSTKFSYDGAGNLTGTTVTPSSKTEAEDKEREVARLRGEWKHKLGGDGQFSFYAAAQQGGEKKDKTALEFNNLGVQTKITEEHIDKEEKEWYAGVKFARPLGRHTISAGLEYRDKARRDDKTQTENGKDKATGRGDTFDIDETRWTAWLQDEVHLGGGHFLTPGLRLLSQEQSAVDGLGVATGGTTRAASPSLHWLWRVNGRNNLRASVTETLKPPKFDELSTVTETKGGTEADPDKSGNPDLGPEKALGVELGWEHFLPRAGGVLGVNLFGRDIKDKIEERTGLEGARWVSRPRNVGDARVWGYELDARPRMDVIGMPELMLRFNYSRLFSELQDSATGLETRVKDQPPYVYNVGFDWQLPRWEAAWGMNYNYTPRFIKNPAETTKLDPEAEQKLLDLYVMKRLTRDLALRFTASNLLDMKKEKDKYEFDSKTGNLSKRTLESERGGRGFFLALEGRW